VIGHGWQSPSWQIESQVCFPQFNFFPQISPQLLESTLSEQRITKSFFPQKHSIFLFAGHSGHEPGWHNTVLIHLLKFKNLFTMYVDIEFLHVSFHKHFHMNEVSNNQNSQDLWCVHRNKCICLAFLLFHFCIVDKLKFQLQKFDFL
jgi:hypothetical protein